MWRGPSQAPAMLFSAFLFLLSAPPQAQAAGYTRLIFSDEFNDLDLSEDGGGKHRWFNGIWVHRPAERSRFVVRNGVLTVHTKGPEPRGGSATQISTLARKPGGTSTLFHYGYFEARMRWPKTKQNWATFWLESIEPAKTGDRWYFEPWPAYCEIDIAEGHKAGSYSASVHDWKYKPPHSGRPIGQEYPEISSEHFFEVDTSKWNVYGLLWKPGSISFYLNDRLIKTIQSPATCEQQQMFLIMGIMKHGGLEEQQSQIDWVRVYR